jgi:hypothetical protein
MRGTRQWPGYSDVEIVRVEAATLKMRIGDTRAFLPVVAGLSGTSNVYLDICIPVDALVVTESSAWTPPQVDDPECAPYSAYLPSVGTGGETAPREPLRFRALQAGAFSFRYRIVTAAGPPLTGEFSILLIGEHDRRSNPIPRRYGGRLRPRRVR